MEPTAPEPGGAPDPAMGAAANHATPRYLMLARALEDAIQGGTYRVGSLLPTEMELAASFGVSRQTVRQAILRLRQGGLVSARKGVGTRVDANLGTQRLDYSVKSTADIVEIAEGTELAVLSTAEVVARGRLTTLIGCRAGHRFLHLGCIRREDAGRPPLCWTDVYIEGRLAPALTLPERMRAALFVLVEQQSGEAITEIRQDIRATVIDADMAARLQAAQGSTALEITRRYVSTGSRLVMAAVNTMPSDRFFHSMALTRP